MKSYNKKVGNVRLLRVDDEVFAALERRARPFVDTPNSTLRRILGLKADGAIAAEAEAIDAGVEHDAILDDIAFGMQRTRKRAPKVDLDALVRAGAVREGEALQLIDHRGSRIRRIEAVVDGGRLRFEGKGYSMSGLARQLLAQTGFRSEAVRGPAHWINRKGQSVLDLWKKQLKRHPRG